MGNVFFVPHGGGPLPLMGDPDHQGVADVMRGLQRELADSKAIIVVTAHWEAPSVQLSSAASLDMVFDYYGFPPETYEYTYSAPGAPDLASRVSSLLTSAGIDNDLDDKRGFDHGTFVPMMLMQPEATVPILQMSLMNSLDPSTHVAIGRALAPLLGEGVSIVGSGMSFHNLRALLRGEPVAEGMDTAFDDWLNETLWAEDLDVDAREARMIAWSDAPGAKACHPREEHLLPLHVCFGAGAALGRKAEVIFRDRLMGYVTSGFAWRSS